MRVKEIHFNHTPGSDNGSITLGYCPLLAPQGEPLTITAPEWLAGKSKPAAYARNAVTDPIRIKASFKNGPPNRRIMIRAFGPDDLHLRRTGPSRQVTSMGEVQPQLVGFDNAGNTGLQDFEVSSRISHSRVGAIDVPWSWQARDGGGEWHPFDETFHRVYVTLAHPTPPWWIRDTLAMNPHPWMEALSLACGWGGGAQTTEEAILRVAQGINSYSKLVYDALADRFVKNDQFLLGELLREFTLHPSVAIDCKGISSMLITLANLLGANLRPVRLESFDGNDFATNNVLALSGPNWGSQTWYYHQVALDPNSPVLDNMGGLLVGATLTPGKVLNGVEGTRLLVYDANLHVNQTAPVFPMRIELGTAGSGDQRYRDLLIQRRRCDLATVKVVPKVM